jgi:O-antigen ligase
LTLYQFRDLSGWWLFAILSFSILAFGTVETWAEMVVEVSTFLLALVWIGWTLKRRDQLVSHWLLLVPLLVVLTASTQLVLDIAASRYGAIHDLVLWVTYLVFLALCINVFQDRWIRERFAHARVLLCFFVAVAGLLQHYLSPDLVYGLREAPDGSVFGPFIDRNHYAVLIELTLPWALVVAFRSSEKRLIYFVFCGLMVASVVVCGSRAGMAIVSAEFLCVVAARLLWRDANSKRRESRTLLSARVLGPATLVVLLGLSVASSSALRRFSPEELERGISRIEVAKITWQMFAEKPLLGYGLGSFDAVYPSFTDSYDGYRWHHAHNDPAELAMELGLVGIAVQLMLFGWALSRRHSRDIWLGALLPLVAAWGHSWLEFPLRMPSLVLVGITVLAQAVSTSNAETTGRRRIPRSAAPTEQSNS